MKDNEVFRRPTIDYGVVTWLDGQIDCAPEFMYENSYAYDTMAIREGEKYGNFL